MKSRFRFLPVASNAELVEKFRPRFDQVLFYYIDDSDKLARARSLAFAREALKMRVHAVPKDGDIDGFRTSDPDIIGLIVKHKLVFSRPARQGYQALLFPKLASPGMVLQEYDDGSIYIPRFICYEFVWALISSQEPLNPLLKEARRLPLEQQARYLFNRLLLERPRHPLISKARSLDRAFLKEWNTHLSPGRETPIHRWEVCDDYCKTL